MITYKLKKYFSICTCKTTWELFGESENLTFENLDVLYILSVNSISNYKFKIKYGKSKKLLFKVYNLLLKYLVQLAKDIFDHHDNQWLKYGDPWTGIYRICSALVQFSPKGLLAPQD